MPPFASALLKFLDDMGRADLYNLFIEHFRYGTADVEMDGERVVAAVRWNIRPSGKVAEILDLFISPDVDGLKIMRNMIRRGKRKFPNAVYIKFVRELKYKNGKNHIYRIS